MKKRSRKQQTNKKTNKQTNKQTKVQGGAWGYKGMQEDVRGCSGV